MDTSLDDTTLLRQLAGGDTEAFWKLWERHGDHVTRLCRHWLAGRPDDVEDAVSDTMAEAFRCLPARACEMGNLEAWLGRVAYHVCARRWREQGRCTPDTPGLESDDQALATRADDGPEEVFIRKETRDRLLLLAGSLPPHLRQPLCLSILDRVTHKEIAARLGVSEECVHNRLREARSRLRQGMSDYLPDRPPAASPGIGEGARVPAAVMVSGRDGPEIRWAVAETRMVQVALPSGAVVDFQIALGRKAPRRAARERTLNEYISRYPSGWRKRLELADMLYAGGRWDEAAAIYREVLARQPEMLEVWVRVGDLLRLTGKTEDAAAAYRAALPHARTPAGRLSLEGLLQLCRGQYDRAAEHFRRAARLEPDNPAHWHALAWTYRSCEQPLEALDAYEQALRLDPDDPVALVDSYLPLMHLGGCREIERRLTRAVEVDPGNVMALVLLASRRAATGRVHGPEGRQTRQLVARALRLAPHAADVTRTLAGFHLARGEWAHAVAVVGAFVEQHPDSPGGWYSRAEVLLHSGQYQLAADSILRALALRPLDPWIYLQAPFILGQAGRRETMTRTVDDMLRRFPNRWDVFVVSSITLSRYLGEVHEGIRLSARATELQPRIPLVWSTYAGRLQTAGRHREALGAMDQGWQLTPRDAGAGYQAWRAFFTAGIQRALGDEVRARGWLERAVHSARDATETFSLARSLYCEASAREALGDRGGAILNYQRALARQLPYPDRAAVVETLRRMGAHP